MSANQPRSRPEQETIIRRAGDKQEWEVCTNDRRVVTKLTKLHGPGMADYQCSDMQRWTLPAECVGFRAKSKPRAMTDEQRQAASDRMAKVNAGRKSKESSA